MATICVRDSVGDLRVYEPAIQDDGAPPPKERERDRLRLLQKIQQHYEDALSRLTENCGCGAMILERFLGGGVCVGLLDARSNIIANTHLTGVTRPVGRDEVLAAGVVMETELRDITRRSLDGLVAFLTCFFPYLAGWEAVRYLLLAGADPLVAARVISEDRGLKAFRSASDGALRLALRCAAITAKHPRPELLALVWTSPPLESIRLLTAQRELPRDDCHHVFGKVSEEEVAAADPPSHLCRPWPELAARDGSKVVIEVPYQHSTSLRRVLLGMIHGFYLKALARMPTGELQSRFHRGLLKAGHCYGPFDPVSNIILNTIWYENSFPPPIEEAKLDAVGTLSLMRIEARSFYGLVSCLCTRYPHLTMHQALRCLLDTDLNMELSLEAAMRMQDQQQRQSRCSSVQSAYRAAAIAAWHPKPDAQVEFLCSCKDMLGVSRLLDGGQQLRSQEVQHLASLLCPNSLAGTPLQQPLAATRRLNAVMAEGRKQRRALRRISKKINAALRRYESQNSPQCYQLHVICGVNKFVSGPEYGEGCAPGVYHRTHANFLATQHVGSIASTPTLFFAELSNGDDDQDSQLLCCPMNFPPPCAEPVRCLFCENKGIRIVHPASQTFHGLELEFDKMVRKEDLYDKEFDPELEEQLYTNHRILENSELVAEWVEGLDEDCMYVDSDDFSDD
ncbi:uncharacterized protein LOC124656473 [Lolium rigidum]|uniref:uncharacterized protein LOC124656473 n=1 Tax=Lolium rigidum TaxID=89674 RepID=UPI001F5DCBD1|nr:uncharacterized protein LOC124656473 [Lolium rigidum]